jgi:hypothetical protein
MVLKEGRRWACLPWERELQQVESTAMQDLRRADATAVCRGNSVSNPATADLQEPPCKRRPTPINLLDRLAVTYLRRRRAARAGEADGRDAPRLRPARGAGRRAALAAEAAARPKDAIFLLLRTCCVECVKP